MKFRNKKTREIYDVGESRDCVESGFCKGIKCAYCGISIKYSGTRCSNWVNEHPQEAAELMGYEWIKEDNMKPRLCEILGVEVNEEFAFEKINLVYKINELGRLLAKNSDCEFVPSSSAYLLCEMIAHPEKIVKVKKWTDEEKTLAKILKKAGVYSVHRGKYAVSWEYRSDIPGKGFLPNRTFPSLRENETVTLDEIIGESNGEE